MKKFSASKLGIKKIIFLSYFFSIEDGVGSSRSRSLAGFLEQKGFNLNIVSKDTWTKNIDKNTFFWGLKCASYIIKNRKSFDKVYISCGPFIPLLPVAIAAGIANKPLIIDFRDPWSLNIATNYGDDNTSLSLKQRIRLRISRIIEKFSYNLCEHFIVCTEGMKTEYYKLFSDNKKIRLITNGYDFNPKKYNDIPVQHEEVRFVCIGNFAEYANKKAALILSEVIKYSTSTNRPVKLIFIGSNREQNEPIVYKSGLNAEWHPRLSYHEALSIAAKADFGLLVVRNETYDYTTKVFDYIGLGLPIFNYFKDDNNFTRYFKEYLSTEINHIPFEKRLGFSREQVFNSNIDIFY